MFLIAGSINMIITGDKEYSVIGFLGIIICALIFISLFSSFYQQINHNGVYIKYDTLKAYMLTNGLAEIKFNPEINDVEFVIIEKK